MKVVPVLLFAAALALPGTPVRAKQENDLPARVLYRYKDDKGIQVLDDRVPPRHVAKGYEILNLSGRLLKVVPPQLTGEQLAEQQRRQAQVEEDQRMLKRYNSIADIESARERKLAIIEQDMAIMRSNIVNLGNQIEQQQKAAARIQRNGREVAPEVLARIADLRKEAAVLEKRLVLREKEADAINEEFDKVSARYAQITE